MAAAVASSTSGRSAQSGASRKNGCSRRCGVDQQQRALTEVVEQQRRQHEREPRQADRPFAEMAHVGVQRLAARDDEEHRAEHGEPMQPWSRKERDGVPRIDRRRARPAAVRSSRARGPRSTRNHSTMIGPNSRPTRWVPCRWMAKTPIMIATATGTTYGSNSGVATFSPSIAPRTVIAGVIMPSPYSSAAPKIPSRISTGRPTSPVRAVRHQRRQRQDAALTLIVGPHDDRDVLDRDDKQQRVDDQREDARTFSCVGGTEWDPKKHSRMAYSGLVPMSP